MVQFRRSQHGIDDDLAYRIKVVFRPCSKAARFSNVIQEHLVSQATYVERLLRKVNHVRAEKRLSVLLEVLLISLQHAIEPGEQLLGTVVGVENNRDAIRSSDLTDILGALKNLCRRP